LGGAEKEGLGGTEKDGMGLENELGAASAPWAALPLGCGCGTCEKLGIGGSEKLGKGGSEKELGAACSARASPWYGAACASMARETNATMDLGNIIAKWYSFSVATYRNACTSSKATLLLVNFGLG
jgi:hypothetical protein